MLNQYENDYYRRELRRKAEKNRRAEHYLEAQQEPNRRTAARDNSMLRRMLAMVQ